ncbi:MAG: hypothetical protein U1E99_05950 [Agitococcus sp.]
MNMSLENTIIARLHCLDDDNLYKVLDFIEHIDTLAKKPPKMTGLFAHLNTTDNEISAALHDVKLERESALNQSLDIL